MTDTSFKIEGMTCQHCVMRVKKAIANLNGILESEVTLGNARVKFDETKIKKVDVEKAITDAGYKVI